MYTLEHTRLTLLHILGLVSRGAFLVTLEAFLVVNVVSFLLVLLASFIGSKIGGMGDLTFACCCSLATDLDF